MSSRLFLSQSVLDRWLSEGAAELTGEVLRVLPDRHEFLLKTAVLFESEVTGAGDGHALLGRVKDLDQIATLSGDYSAGTVIVGDLAYEVTDGFVGEPVAGTLSGALGPRIKDAEPEALPVEAPLKPDSTPGSIEAALGASAGASGTKDLARFFLERN